MTRTMRAILCGTALVAPWLVCLPALAADQPATQVGEIIVTATKRAEDIQNVAAAVTAISGSTLRDQGLTTLKDITAFVPNLMWSENTGTTMISIRGVGSTVNSGLTDPTVSVYVDGVYLPRSTMAATRAIDLDRIEVLRGPQGTLYGRDALGGAINFVSQTPSNTLSGMVTLMAGGRSDIGSEGYVSGPITDRLQFRLSGGYENQTGYVLVENTGQHLNGTDALYGRAALRFEPTDHITVDLAVRYERDTAPNAYQQLITPEMVVFVPPTAQTTEPNRLFGNFPFTFKTDTLIASATTNWQLGHGLTLRSITSYIDHSNNETFDADSTVKDIVDTVPYFSRPSKSEGQEIALLGDNGRFQWIAGAFLFHEEASLSLPLRFGTDLTSLFGLPTGFTIDESVGSNITSYALYGDLRYAVTDRLKLEVGLRYSEESLHFAQNYTVFTPATGTVPGEPAYDNGSLRPSLKSQKLLPKVGIQYKVSDNANLYASYSVGYKSGGENLEGGSGASIGTLGLYKPEQLYAYEVGLKSQWFDRKLTANVAAFYYVYNGLQVTNIVPPTNGFVQSADTINYGLEAETSWKATDNLRFALAGTWLHARFHNFLSFDEANPQLGVQNLNGRPIPDAPDETANLSVDYTVPMVSRLLSAVVLHGDVRYSSNVVIDWFGSPAGSQPAYGLFDLSAKLMGADGKTSLDVFVNNVGNVHYKLYSFYVAIPFNAYLGNYGTPRTWGVRLSHRF
ncbi:MAG: TonB-dependent receptor [Caulobacteraceae bacterium]